ncbi:MAG: right-handed parallel beta-helix repeat-containing protein [Capsulimonadaceae bacterium]|nr:right-handed parallel beta-helix repeat-containing protein [Capsulimonadaceae bacterium]
MNLLCAAALLATCGARADTLTPGNHWGITPLDPASVQRGIDAARAAGASKVVIPPGRYVIDQSSDPAGLIRLDGLKNFEIDARGVTLAFPNVFKHDLYITNCENVRISGPTITRGVIVSSQGTVAAIAPDRKSIDIRIHAGYPTNVADRRYFGDAPVLTFYRPGSREILPGTYNVFYGAPQQLEKDLFRFPLARPLAQSPFAVGQYVAWRGTVRDDIILGHCSRMRLEKIVMLGGTGFAIHEHNCDGGNYYQYDVTYPPMPPGATVAPLLSTNADAFHSSNVRKGPTLENCHFEGMHDDGIPIHGAYSLALESSENSVVINLPDPGADYRPGDRLAFYDLNGAQNAIATLVSIEPIKYPAHYYNGSKYFSERPSTPLNYRRITLDRPVPAQLGWMLADTDVCGSGFVIRGCTIRNARARGMLIKASDGLIENCTIEGTTSGGIVLAPEMKSWNEADFSKNILIRNNTIRHCGLYMHNDNFEQSAMTIGNEQDGHFTPSPGHANIRIEHNKFIDNPGPNILITSASNVTIKDNEFIRPMQEWDASDEGITNLGENQNALIFAAQANGLAFSENRVSSPGKHMNAIETTGPNVVQSGLPSGITLRK